MVTTLTPDTSDLTANQRTAARLGVAALVAGTALNMLRMAPIFLSDGFEIDQLPRVIPMISRPSQPMVAGTSRM